MNPTREQQLLAAHEAAEWNQRLAAGDLDESQQREYKLWLRSPLNAREMARICLIDTLLHRGALRSGAGHRAPAKIIDFEAYAPITRPRAHAQSTGRPRASGWKVAAAAATAGLLILTAVFMMTLRDVTPTEHLIVTRVGKWDKQLLEDGSVVYVGPDTELRFHFGTELRSIAVLRGEALFEVAKDPGRPFVVGTSAGSVRAVGTEFAVAYQGDSVVVTVAEGKVAVTPEGPGNSLQPIIPLTANQQVVLRPTGADEPLAVSADHELKWIRNWFEYDGERIGEIIEELNRRHAAQVVVDNSEVVRLRMNSLVFRPSEPEDFVGKINQWYAASRLLEASGGGSDRALHLQRPLSGEQQ